MVLQRWTEYGMKALEGQRMWDKYTRKCRKELKGDEYVGKRVMRMDVEGRGRKGRSKRDGCRL